MSIDYAYIDRAKEGGAIVLLRLPTPVVGSPEVISLLKAIKPIGVVPGDQNCLFQTAWGNEADLAWYLVNFLRPRVNLEVDSERGTVLLRTRDMDESADKEAFLRFRFPQVPLPDSLVQSISETAYRRVQKLYG